MEYFSALTFVLFHFSRTLPLNIDPQMKVLTVDIKIEISCSGKK